MKKLVFLLMSFVCLQTLTAQTRVSNPIYLADNIHQGVNKKSYFILSQDNNKDLTKTLEEFLSKYGKVTKPEKNIYRVEKPKNHQISSDLNYIDVISKSNKNLEKLEFFFINDGQNSLNVNELNTNQPIDFISEFLEFNRVKLEQRLLKLNLDNTEDELKEAEKAQKKIEKSIESNLKEQQKLGKKLDSSPELITKALSEKDEIQNQMMTETNVTLDEKTLGNLSKAASKKEKEISKIKKDAAKAENRLDKKEDELENLKKDLIKAKSTVRSFEKILSDSKMLISK